MLRHARAVLLPLTIATTLAAAPPADDGGAFLAQVRQHFAAWDADHDGTLSAAEIERAVADPANRGPAAAAAATLRRTYYANPTFRPITLQHLTAAVGDTRPADQPKPPPYDRQYAADLRLIAGTNRAVFASGHPRTETLGQGHLGDCFLLASVGTMAACQPQRLAAMVVPNVATGQVAVHLGNGKVVTQPMPNDAELCIGSGTLNDGVWGQVFERAIGQALLDRHPASKAVTPFQLIGTGGSPAASLGVLTGHACRRLGCEDFQRPGRLTATDRARRLDAVRDALTTAFATAHLVVGGTADLHAGQTVVPGLYYDHSYGVLAYDRPTDSVTFWNPMGNAYTPSGEPGLQHGWPTRHGRFQNHLPDAVLWFGSFSVETDDPARP